MIQLNNIVATYTTTRGQVNAVDGVNLTIPSGKIVGIAGESGCGKSTLLKVLYGDVTYPLSLTAGSVRYGIDGDRLILGVANIWEPRKGLSDFIALAKKLDGKARVVLIGLSDRQINDLPHGVTGIRRTANAAELAAWYTAADVFVNPTLEDNFPTTQIESLACGTPVVCYDTGGCAEALDETCGVVVPKGDVGGLAAGVERALFLLKSQDCLKRAAAFDQNDRFAEYVALYQRLSGEGES